MNARESVRLVTDSPGLDVLEALYLESPVLFEKLIFVLKTRPAFGEITLLFRDRKLTMIEKREQMR